MAKKKSGSTVAPKERVNITYKPATGNAKENIELPFKIVVLGDFTRQEDDRVMEEREPVGINAHNFDAVMAEQNLSMQFSVPNKIVGDSDDDIDIDMDIKSLKDLTPDRIIENVPQLKEVFKIREALQALKGPLGNSPQMRKYIQSILSDQSKRQALEKEIDS